MARQPKHPRLPAHNERVVRLARDYDKKYRPVVIPIAKHMNLVTGDSFPKVATIQKESARYTGDRKPLSRASVFRLLAEMRDHGAIKTEARFGPTGRQRSSYRYLDLHVAIRFGQPVEHLWDAPVAGDETPGETPGETPDETPITLSISLKNSPTNSGKTREVGASPSREIERGPGFARPAKDESSGMCNTFMVWKSKSTGKTVHFRTDKPSRQTPPKHAKKIILSPAEASFMFRLLSPREQPGFLLASNARRQYMMDKLDGPGARAEREARRAAQEEYAKELARQAEARPGAERAELEPLITRYCELKGEDAAAVRDQIERIGKTTDHAHQSRMTSLKMNIWRLETGQPEMW